jgi:sugar O-acyltransferase (sialic acid O-acetyltransferase NeuD family)
MRLVLLGAANPETARVISAVERNDPNLRVIGFLDNDPQKWNSSFVGLPVFGGFDVIPDLLSDDLRFVNLITGSTRTRFETSRDMALRGCRFANLIHPSVDQSFSEMGVGNYIQEGVTLQAMTKIGNNSSIHMGSLIAHEVSIGHSVFIAHGVSLSGSVSIGDGTFIGTHATVIPRIRIGRWVTVGAGAVVIRDIPDYATVVGNPARIVKQSVSSLESGDIFGAETRHV